MISTNQSQASIILDQWEWTTLIFYEFQGRHGSHHRLWHHQPGVLQQHGQVGAGREEQHQQHQRQHHASWKQVRLDEGEKSDSGEWQNIFKKQWLEAVLEYERYLYQCRVYWQGWNIVEGWNIKLFQIRKSFLEASALDSTNVESAFTSVVTEIFHSVSQVRLCPPINLIIYLFILTNREESVMASESSPSQDWEMGRRLFYQSQQIRNLNEAVVVLGSYFDWDLLKFLHII